MKGKVIAGGGILLFLCLALAIFLYLQKGISVEKVLPENTLVYLRVDDISSDFKKFTSTEIWKTIVNFDYAAFAEKGLLTQDQASGIKDFLSKGLSFDDNPFLKNIFSEKIAVAVYPLENQLQGNLSISPEDLPKIKEKILAGFVFVIQADLNLQISELFARFAKSPEDMPLETKKYKNYIFHVLTLPDPELKFYFVRIKNLVIFSAGEDLVKSCVDVFQKEKRSLAQEEQFHKFFNRLKGHLSMIVYWDMGQAIRWLKEEFLKTKQGESEEFFRYLSAFKTFGVSIKWDELTEIKMYHSFNKEELDPGLAKVYSSCPKLENQSFQFIPQDVLAYQWANCFDSEYYWQKIKPQLKAENWKEIQGMDIEKEILPAIGGEIGGYLEDIEVAGLFPIPKLLIFLKIKNKETIQDLFNQLLGQAVLNVKKENYHDIEISYLDLPLGGKLSPGYCFLNGYLLVAVNQEMLQKAIEVFSAKGQSLLTAESFREIDFGLSKKNEGTAFIRVDQMLDKFKNILDWISQWTTAEYQKKLAFQQGSELRWQKLQEELADDNREVAELKNQHEELSKDGSSQEALKELEQNIKVKQQGIDAGIEKEKELKTIIEGYQKTNEEPQKFHVYMEEIAYPLLDAFKSIRSLGTTVHLHEDMMETMIFLKIQKESFSTPSP